MDLFSTKVAHASVDTFIMSVNANIINPLIVFLFSLALAFFLFGVLKFLTNQENEEKRTQGKQHMLWGVIGITIMMGVFTIMNIILSTLNISGINVEQGTVDLNP
ncbi:hypothetical protein HZA26_03840 [Candidatus Nomurabacteria bacterium]|nr:hypothetical protein [Candidatus Nomurabacteria bacterium]